MIEYFRELCRAAVEITSLALHKLIGAALFLSTVLILVQVFSSAPAHAWTLEYQLSPEPARDTVTQDGELILRAGVRIVAETDEGPFALSEVRMRLAVQGLRLAAEQSADNPVGTVIEQLAENELLLSHVAVSTAGGVFDCAASSAMDTACTFEVGRLALQVAAGVDFATRLSVALSTASAQISVAGALSVPDQIMFPSSATVFTLVEKATLQLSAGAVSVLPVTHKFDVFMSEHILSLRLSDPGLDGFDSAPISTIVLQAQRPDGQEADIRLLRLKLSDDEGTMIATAAGQGGMAVFSSLTWLVADGRHSSYVITAYWDNINGYRQTTLVFSVASVAALSPPGEPRSLLQSSGEVPLLADVLVSRAAVVFVGGAASWDLSRPYRSLAVEGRDQNGNIDTGFDLTVPGLLLEARISDAGMPWREVAVDTDLYIPVRAYTDHVARDGLPITFRAQAPTLGVISKQLATISVDVWADRLLGGDATVTTNGVGEVRVEQTVKAVMGTVDCVAGSSSPCIRGIIDTDYSGVVTVAYNPAASSGVLGEPTIQLIQGAISGGVGVAELVVAGLAIDWAAAGSPTIAVSLTAGSLQPLVATWSYPSPADAGLLLLPGPDIDAGLGTSANISSQTVSQLLRIRLRDLGTDGFDSRVVESLSLIATAGTELDYLSFVIFDKNGRPITEAFGQGDRVSFDALDWSVENGQRLDYVVGIYKRSSRSGLVDGQRISLTIAAVVAESSGRSSFAADAGGEVSFGLDVQAIGPDRLTGPTSWDLQAPYRLSAVGVDVDGNEDLGWVFDPTAITVQASVDGGQWVDVSLDENGRVPMSAYTAARDKTDFALRAQVGSGRILTALPITVDVVATELETFAEPEIAALPSGMARLRQSVRATSQGVIDSDYNRGRDRLAAEHDEAGSLGLMGVVVSLSDAVLSTGMGSFELAVGLSEVVLADGTTPVLSLRLSADTLSPAIVRLEYSPSVMALASLSVAADRPQAQQTEVGVSSQLQVTVSARGIFGEAFRPADGSLSLTAESLEAGVVADGLLSLYFDVAGVATTTVSLMPAPGVDGSVLLGVTGQSADVQVISNAIAVIAAEILSTVTLTVLTPGPFEVVSTSRFIDVRVQLSMQGIGKPLTERYFNVRADYSQPADRFIVNPAVTIPDEDTAVISQFSLSLSDSVQESTVHFSIFPLPPGVALVTEFTPLRISLAPILERAILSLREGPTQPLPARGRVTAQYVLQVAAIGSDGLPFAPPLPELSWVTELLAGSVATLSPTLGMAAGLNTVLGETGVSTAALTVTLGENDRSATLRLSLMGLGDGDPLSAAMSEPLSLEIGRVPELVELRVEAEAATLYQTGIGAPVQTLVRVTARDSFGGIFVPSEGRLRLSAASIEGALQATFAPSMLRFDERGVATATVSILPVPEMDGTMLIGVAGQSSAVRVVSDRVSVFVATELRTLSLSISEGAQRRLPARGRASAQYTVQVAATGFDGRPVDITGLGFGLAARLIGGSAEDYSPTPSTPTALVGSVAETGISTVALSVTLGENDRSATVELFAVDLGGSGRNTMVMLSSAVVTVARVQELFELRVQPLLSTAVQTLSDQPVPVSVVVQAVDIYGESFVSAAATTWTLSATVTDGEATVLFADSAILRFTGRGQTTVALSVLPSGGRDVSLLLIVTGLAETVQLYPATVRVVAAEVLDRFTIDAPASLRQSGIDQTVGFEVSVLALGSKGSVWMPQDVFLTHSVAAGAIVDYSSDPLDFSNRTARAQVIVLVALGEDATIVFGLRGAFTERVRFSTVSVFVEAEPELESADVEMRVLERLPTDLEMETARIEVQLLAVDTKGRAISTEQLVIETEVVDGLAVLSEPSAWRATEVTGVFIAEFSALLAVGASATVTARLLHRGAEVASAELNIERLVPAAVRVEGPARVVQPDRDNPQVLNITLRLVDQLGQGYVGSTTGELVFSAADTDFSLPAVGWVSSVTLSASERIAIPIPARVWTGGLLQLPLIAQPPVNGRRQIVAKFRSSVPGIAGSRHVFEIVDPEALRDLCELLMEGGNDGDSCAAVVADANGSRGSFAPADLVWDVEAGERGGINLSQSLSSVPILDANKDSCLRLDFVENYGFSRFEIRYRFDDGPVDRFKVYYEIVDTLGRIKWLQIDRSSPGWTSLSLEAATLPPELQSRIGGLQFCYQSLSSLATGGVDIANILLEERLYPVEVAVQVPASVVQIDPARLQEVAVRLQTLDRLGRPFAQSVAGELLVSAANTDLSLRVADQDTVVGRGQLVVAIPPEAWTDGVAQILLSARPSVVGTTAIALEFRSQEPLTAGSQRVIQLIDICGVAIAGDNCALLETIGDAGGKALFEPSDQPWQPVTAVPPNELALRSPPLTAAGGEHCLRLRIAAGNGWLQRLSLDYRVDRYLGQARVFLQRDGLSEIEEAVLEPMNYFTRWTAVNYLVDAGVRFVEPVSLIAFCYGISAGIAVEDRGWAALDNIQLDFVQPEDFVASGLSLELPASSFVIAPARTTSVSLRIGVLHQFAEALAAGVSAVQVSARAEDGNAVLSLAAPAALLTATSRGNGEASLLVDIDASGVLDLELGLDWTAVAAVETTVRVEISAAGGFTGAVADMRVLNACQLVPADSQSPEACGNFAVAAMAMEIQPAVRSWRPGPAEDGESLALYSAAIDDGEESCLSIALSERKLHRLSFRYRLSSQAASDFFVVSLRRNRSGREQELGRFSGEVGTDGTWAEFSTQLFPEPFGRISLCYRKDAAGAAGDDGVGIDAFELAVVDRFSFDVPQYYLSWKRQLPQFAAHSFVVRAWDQFGGEVVAAIDEGLVLVGSSDFDRATLIPRLLSGEPFSEFDRDPDNNRFDLALPAGFPLALNFELLLFENPAFDPRIELQLLRDNIVLDRGEVETVRGCRLAVAGGDETAESALRCDILSAWTNNRDGAWGPRGARDALYSEPIEDGEASCQRLRLAPENEETPPYYWLRELSFDYLVSSEEGSDFLELWLERQGGAEREWIGRYSGEVGWSRIRHIVDQSSGQPVRTIVFCYRKDDSGAAGEDWAAIDEIDLIAAPQNELVALRVLPKIAEQVFQLGPGLPIPLELQVLHQFGGILNAALEGTARVTVRAEAADTRLILSGAPLVGGDLSGDGSVVGAVRIGSSGRARLGLSVWPATAAALSTLSIEVATPAGVAGGDKRISVVHFCELLAAIDRPGEYCGHLERMVTAIDIEPPDRRWRVMAGEQTGNDLALFSPVLNAGEEACIRLHFADRYRLSSLNVRYYADSRDLENRFRLYYSTAGEPQRIPWFSSASAPNWATVGLEQPADSFARLDICYDKGQPADGDLVGITDITLEEAFYPVAIWVDAPSTVVQADPNQPQLVTVQFGTVDRLDRPSDAVPGRVILRGADTALSLRLLNAPEDSAVSSTDELSMDVPTEAWANGNVWVAFTAMPPVFQHTLLSIEFVPEGGEFDPVQADIKLANFCDVAVAGGSEGLSCAALTTDDGGREVHYAPPDSPWQPLPGEDGENRALYSAQIGDGEESCLRLLLAERRLYRLSFRYRLSSQAASDFFIVSLRRNGSTQEEELGRFSGEVGADGAWAEFSTQLSPEPFGRISLCYRKDAAGAAGDDWVGIDELEFAVVDRFTLDSSQYSLSWLRNLPQFGSHSFVVRAWDQLGREVVTAGDEGLVLVGSSDFDGGLLIPRLGSGEPLGGRDRDLAIDRFDIELPFGLPLELSFELRLFENLPFDPRIELRLIRGNSLLVRREINTVRGCQLAVGGGGKNAESALKCDILSAFTSDKDGVWGPRGIHDALYSEPIGDGETSCQRLRLAPDSVGTPPFYWLTDLSFDYLLSSEEGGDFLELWLEHQGVAEREWIGRYSGEASWNRIHHTVDQSSGQPVWAIVFCYSKDDSGSAGEDWVAIDEIDFTAVPPDELVPMGVVPKIAEQVLQLGPGLPIPLELQVLHQFGGVVNAALEGTARVTVRAEAADTRLTLSGAALVAGDLSGDGSLVGEVRIDSSGRARLELSVWPDTAVALSTVTIEVTAPGGLAGEIRSVSVVHFCEVIAAGGTAGEYCARLTGMLAGIGIDPPDRPWRVMAGEQIENDLALYNPVLNAGEEACIRLSFIDRYRLSSLRVRYFANTQSLTNYFRLYYSTASEPQRIPWYTIVTAPHWSTILQKSPANDFARLDICYDKRQSATVDLVGITSILLEEAFYPTAVRVESSSTVVQVDANQPRSVPVRLRMLDRLGQPVAGSSSGTVFLRGADTALSLRLMDAPPDSAVTGDGELSLEISSAAWRDGAVGVVFTAVPPAYDKTRLDFEFRPEAAELGDVRAEIEMIGFCDVAVTGGSDGDSCAVLTAAAEGREVRYLPSDRPWQALPGEGGEALAVYSAAVAVNEQSCLNLLLGDEALSRLSFHYRLSSQAEDHDFVVRLEDEVGQPRLEIARFSVVADAVAGWNSFTHLFDPPVEPFSQLAFCHLRLQGTEMAARELGLDDIRLAVVDTVGLSAPEFFMSWSDSRSFSSELDFSVAYLDQFGEPLNIAIESSSRLTISVAGDARLVLQFPESQLPRQEGLSALEIELPPGGPFAASLILLPPLGAEPPEFVTTPSITMTLSTADGSEQFARRQISGVLACELAVAGGLQGEACEAFGATRSSDGDWGPRGQRQALYSAPVGPGEASCQRVRVEHEFSWATELSFDYLLSSEEGSDFLEVSLERLGDVSPERIARFSGELGWNSFVHTIDHSSGQPVAAIVFCYRKDLSGSAGQDLAAIAALGIERVANTELVPTRIMLEVAPGFFHLSYGKPLTVALELRLLHQFGGILRDMPSPVQLDVAQSGRAFPLTLGDPTVAGGVLAQGSGSISAEVSIDESGIAVLQLILLPTRNITDTTVSITVSSLANRGFEGDSRQVSVLRFCDRVLAGGNGSALCQVFAQLVQELRMQPADLPWRLLPRQDGGGEALFSPLLADGEESCLEVRFEVDRILWQLDFDYLSGATADQAFVELLAGDGMSTRLSLPASAQPQWSKYHYSPPGGVRLKGFALCYRQDGAAPALVADDLMLLTEAVLSTVTLEIRGPLSLPVRSGQELVTIEVAVDLDYLGEAPLYTRLWLRTELSGAVPPVADISLSVAGPGSGLVPVQLSVAGSGTGLVPVQLSLGPTARQTTVSFSLVGQRADVAVVGPDEVSVVLVPELQSVRLWLAEGHPRRLLLPGENEETFVLRLSALGSDGRPFPATGISLVVVVTEGSVADYVVAPLSLTTATELVDSGVYDTGIAVSLAGEDNGATLALGVLDIDRNTVVHTSVTLRVSREVELARLVIRAESKLLFQRSQEESVHSRLRVFAVGTDGLPFVPAAGTLQLTAVQAGAADWSIEPAALHFAAGGEATARLTVMPELGEDALLRLSLRGDSRQLVTVVTTEVAVVAAGVLSTVTLTVVDPAQRVVLSGTEQVSIGVLVSMEGVGKPLAARSFELQAVLSGSGLPQPQPVPVTVSGEGVSAMTTVTVSLGPVARQTTVRFTVVDLPPPAVLSGPDTVRIVLVPQLQRWEVSLPSGDRALLAVAGEAEAEFAVQVRAIGSDGRNFAGVRVPTLAAIPGLLVGSGVEIRLSTAVAAVEPGVFNSSLTVTLSADALAATVAIGVVQGDRGLATNSSATARVARQNQLAAVVVQADRSVLRRPAVGSESGRAIQLRVTVRATDLLGNPLAPAGLLLEISGSGVTEVLEPLRFDPLSGAVTVTATFSVLPEPSTDTRVMLGVGGEISALVTVTAAELLVVHEYAPGDVNKDGQLNASDGVLMLQYLNSLDAPYLNLPIVDNGVDVRSRLQQLFEAGADLDLNLDGRANGNDVRILFRYMAGLRGEALGENVRLEFIESLFLP